MQAERGHCEAGFCSLVFVSCFGGSETLSDFPRVTQPNSRPARPATHPVSSPRSSVPAPCCPAEVGWPVVLCWRQLVSRERTFVWGSAWLPPQSPHVAASSQGLKAPAPSALSGCPSFPLRIPCHCHAPVPSALLVSLCSPTPLLLPGLSSNLPSSRKPPLIAPSFPFPEPQKPQGQALGGSPRTNGHSVCISLLLVCGPGSGSEAEGSSRLCFFQPRLLQEAVDVLCTP